MANSSDLARAALALAQRFAAGATLWCWSPGAAHHAQHVAVEFVHPVVVGARAMPAVAIDGADIERLLGPNARPGDVLLVIADADTSVAPALQRASESGLTTMWMGAGAPPENGAADHVLWVSDDAVAASDGRLVVGYHVLWELTQICFEHPGLLVDATAVTSDR